MTLEERLEALAAYHEDAAHSVRLTLALLMNGARATAAKSLGTKLKTAIALRHTTNGSGPYAVQDTPPGRPRKARTGARGRRKGPVRPVKGVLLANLRDVMHGLKAPIELAELQAMMQEKGLTFSPQAIGSAVRYGHVKISGTGRRRRYAWIGQ